MATNPSILAGVSVLIESMTTFAMRLTMQHKVVTLQHWFKMIRIHTRFLATQMVKLETKDIPDLELIYCTVSMSHRATPLDFAIS